MTKYSWWVGKLNFEPCIGINTSVYQNTWRPYPSTAICKYMPFTSASSKSNWQSLGSRLNPPLWDWLTPKTIIILYSESIVLLIHTIVKIYIPHPSVSTHKNRRLFSMHKKPIRGIIYGLLDTVAFFTYPTTRRLYHLTICLFRVHCPAGCCCCRLCSIFHPLTLIYCTCCLTTEDTNMN